jgi:hypothetical protein
MAILMQGISIIVNIDITSLRWKLLLIWLLLLIIDVIVNIVIIASNITSLTMRGVACLSRWLAVHHVTMAH